MNKKSMYFTLMTITFLVIFIFMFMVPSYKKLSNKMLSTEMRVDSMDSYIKDLERDMERGLYISSYRALMALEQNIITKGQFLNDTESVFIEALINGSVYGKGSSLMDTSTFPNWVSNIQQKAIKLNIIVNITVYNVTIYQEDPWNVGVLANISMMINDSASIAYWVRNKTIHTSISILRFEDPLYIIYTHGKTTNIFNQTLYEGNYTYNIGGVWYVDNLMSHINSSYYASNADAPNFLMRFENNLSADINGIESLINIKRLEESGVLVEEMNYDSSIVDYYYWPAVSNGDYRVNFTPSWVRMDAGHLVRYEVDDALSYID